MSEFTKKFFPNINAPGEEKILNAVPRAKGKEGLPGLYLNTILVNSESYKIKNGVTIKAGQAFTTESDVSGELVALPWVTGKSYEGVASIEPIMQSDLNVGGATNRVSFYKLSIGNASVHVKLKAGVTVRPGDFVVPETATEFWLKGAAAGTDPGSLIVERVVGNGCVVATIKKV